jgi:uracil-DNA glycosylase family 4
MDSLFSCTACPRLADYLSQARIDHPDWHNKPVIAWGDPEAALLILGLAPGYRGANRTARPFCGDRSGGWVYRALHACGLAESPDPIQAGGALRGARISNAVKCVPPKNKPTGLETRTCRELWLKDELADERLKVILSLGGLSHQAVVDTLGGRRHDHPFAHAAEHRLGELVLLDSYHPSPHNTNTGRLSWEQFLGAFQRATHLAGLPGGEA